MAKKYYETDEFKRLNTKWSKKLEKSGFKDIDPDDTETIQLEIVTLPQYKSQYEQGTQGYYELCQKILRTHEEVMTSDSSTYVKKHKIFKTDVQKRIFELHTEGKSETDISQLLKVEFGQTYSRENINYVVRTIKDTFIYGKKQ